MINFICKLFRVNMKDVKASWTPGMQSFRSSFSLLERSMQHYTNYMANLGTIIGSWAGLATLVAILFIPLSAFLCLDEQSVAPLSSPLYMLAVGWLPVVPWLFIYKIYEVMDDILDYKKEQKDN